MTAVAASAAVVCAEAWAPPRYADLRVTVAAAPAAPAAGQAIVFTVRIHNAGPDSALDTIVRYGVEGGTRLGAVASQGSCGADACALGLMGYRNLAHDARATIRVFVRGDEPRRVAVEAAASSESLAMEITPENTAARAAVGVTPFEGARPAADLALALVSLRRRVATFRVTNHGPDAAAAVVAAGARTGEIAVGAERVVRVRYRRAGRYAVAVRATTADPNGANDRVAIRVR